MMRRPELDLTVEVSSELKITRDSTALRTRAARFDGSVGSLRRHIEKAYNLLQGSVALCGPDKNALRSNATIGILRKRWE